MKPVKCSRCDGYGELEEVIQCKECHGLGFVDAPDFDGEFTNTCEVCNGTGEVTIRVECPNCYGYGEVGHE